MMRIPKLLGLILCGFPLVIVATGQTSQGNASQDGGQIVPENLTGVAKPATLSFSAPDILEADDDPNLERAKRVDNMVYQQNAGHLVDQRYFVRDFNLTEAFTDYGRCAVSLGYEDNPGCQSGEVCVDKDTLLPVLCPSDNATCSACTKEQTVTDDCPRGCKPGADCATPPIDGVCEGQVEIV